MMKAAVYERYGSPEVLHIQEVARPVPRSNEVLVQVFAATMNRTDCGYRSALYVVSRLFTGLLKPRRVIWGSEFAGRVVEVGSGVTTFKVGDRVFGFDDVFGAAHAEFMAIRESGPIATIPAGFNYTQIAAAGEGAIYALNVIRASKVTRGDKVLVYGASGAIGSAAVQILKSMGVEVTAVCGTKGLAMVTRLAPATILNYETDDFTATDERYNLVFDAVGKSSYGVCKKLLTPKGIYYSTELGAGGQNPLLAIWFAMTGSRRVIFPLPKIDKEMVEAVRSMLEDGLFAPVIDRVYPLDQIVEAAHYVESQQKLGNVVIEVVREG